MRILRYALAGFMLQVLVQVAMEIVLDEVELMKNLTPYPTLDPKGA